MDLTKGKTEYIAVVDVVKAAACIVIFLAHCNTILPGDWDWLIAFGQDFGNNMFFMVSGFALAPSVDSTPVNRVHIWYLKRLARILPITFIAYAVMFFMGYYSFSDPAQLFVVFIYPTLYWFVSAILIFYLILFFMAKLAGKRGWMVINIALAVLYILSGARQERLYLMGLISMTAGYMLREYIGSGYEKDRERTAEGRKLTAELVAACVLYIAGEVTDIRYLSAFLTFGGALWAGSIIMLQGYIHNEALTAFFEGREHMLSLIKFIGGMALPLYIVQCLCAGYIGYTIGQKVAFPLSFLVNLIIVWSAGTVLYLIGNISSRRIVACIMHEASGRRTKPKQDQ